MNNRERMLEMLDAISLKNSDKDADYDFAKDLEETFGRSFDGEHNYPYTKLNKRNKDNGKSR